MRVFVQNEFKRFIIRMNNKSLTKEQNEFPRQHAKNN